MSSLAERRAKTQCSTPARRRLSRENCGATHTRRTAELRYAQAMFFFTCYPITVVCSGVIL